MTRRANRAQREEIMGLQNMLKEWCGIQYEPKLRADGQVLINILERAQPGGELPALCRASAGTQGWTLEANASSEQALFAKRCRPT